MNNINKSGTVDISGFKLKYIIEGEGFTILIIGSSTYYQRVFSENLRKHFKLIFIDHRGDVPPPRENIENSEFNLDVLLEDIEIIRKYIGLEQFIIIGHSGHGFLALEYAKKYSQYIKGCILISSATNNSEQRRKASEKFFEDDASPERKEVFYKKMSLLPEKIASDPDKRFINYLISSAPQSWFDYNFDPTPLWKDVYNNMQMIDYVWGTVFGNIDITENLENFDKPILLVLGKYDYLIGPTELWNDIIPKFKNITVEIFEKSSHCPQYEESESFDKLLINWSSAI